MDIASPQANTSLEEGEANFPNTVEDVIKCVRAPKSNIFNSIEYTLEVSVQSKLSIEVEIK